jgi:hypothetical protein
MYLWRMKSDLATLIGRGRYRGPFMVKRNMCCFGVAPPFSTFSWEQNFLSDERTIFMWLREGK